MECFISRVNYWQMNYIAFWWNKKLSKQHSRNAIRSVQIWVPEVEDSYRIRVIALIPKLTCGSSMNLMTLLIAVTPWRLDTSVNGRITTVKDQRKCKWTILMKFWHWCKLNLASSILIASEVNTVSWAHRLRWAEYDFSFQRNSHQDPPRPSLLQCAPIHKPDACRVSCCSIVRFTLCWFSK